MFNKILVANRSEIARRVMRTCAEMGIRTVAVFSEHDVFSPFLCDADEAVALPKDSGYLDTEAIVAAALATGADAVHPGYGFLAENAEFASAVEAAGITFIGPTPGTIASMGSKLHAREVVDRCGVPVLPIVEPGGGSNAIEAAEEIGYPVLVKASSGGGGKGMRIVREPSELDAAIESAGREAESAFGDGTVYLERYIDRPRHIEVQILGDGEGHVIHLYERECSIQRRFQKVIEEAPAPHLDQGTREALWDAAVAVGTEENYRGAGTVEFIVDPEGGFFFLEMNTRLQVEHPVTELTTGLDLVRLQIEVAAGGALPNQVDVPPVTGHAIEARLNAESPADGYLPSIGTVHRFCVPDEVRVDTGIANGASITHHYDPMVAKVISHAPTRAEAAARLAMALTHAEVHGVDTNRDLLIRVLGDAEFLGGAVDTHFLERRGSALTAPLIIGDDLRILTAVAALAIQASNRQRARVLSSMPSGFRNVPFQRQSLSLLHAGEPIVATYRISRNAIEMVIDGEEVDVDTLYSVTSAAVDAAIDGVRRMYRTHVVDTTVYIDSSVGSARFEIVSRFPEAEPTMAASAMVAGTPGTVVAVSVAAGDVVAAGDTVMVVEAMKMEQAITAPEAGRVGVVHFSVGEQVDAGSVLVELDAADG